MVDIVDMLNRLNLSPVLTLLLVALLAALRWIGKGILARIGAVEQEAKRFRDEEFQDLTALVHRHTTKIAVVKMKLGMEDED